MKCDFYFIIVQFFSLFLLLTVVPHSEANFEDSRCRCTCPSTEYFSSNNKTNDRRYYTRTKNINSAICNTQTVVRQEVINIIDVARLDAFFANCNCKFETRNSLLLKVVIIFVMCVLICLCSYMAYLFVVEPMLKRQQPFAPYQRHSSSEDMDENIFAHPSTPTTTSNSIVNDDIECLSSSAGEIQMRPRASAAASAVAQHASASLVDGGGVFIRSVADRVVAEQEKWKISVEEQRRHVLSHQMLN